MTNQILKYRGMDISTAQMRSASPTKSGLRMMYRAVAGVDWRPRAMEAFQGKFGDDWEEQWEEALPTLQEYEDTLSGLRYPPKYAWLKNELGILRPIDLMEEVFDDLDRTDIKAKVASAVVEVREALEAQRKKTAEETLAAFTQQEDVAAMVQSIKAYDSALALIKRQRDEAVNALVAKAKEEVSPVVSWWGDSLKLVDEADYKTKGVPGSRGNRKYKAVYPSGFQTVRDDVGKIVGQVSKNDAGRVKAWAKDEHGNTVHAVAPVKSRSPAYNAVMACIKDLVHNKHGLTDAVVSYNVKRDLLGWEDVTPPDPSHQVSPDTEEEDPTEAKS